MSLTLALTQDIPADPTGGRGVGYSRFDLLDPRAVRLTTAFAY